VNAVDPSAVCSNSKARLEGEVRRKEEVSRHRFGPGSLVTIGRSRSLAEELAMRRFSETFSKMKVLSIDEASGVKCGVLEMAMVGGY
jgi:hypothetical protein